MTATSTKNARSFLSTVGLTLVAGLALIGLYSMTNSEPSMCQPASTHSVTAGETLWDIAAQNNISVEILKEFNDPKSSSVSTGQLLVIPTCD